MGLANLSGCESHQQLLDKIREGVTNLLLASDITEGEKITLAEKMISILQKDKRDKE